MLCDSLISAIRCETPVIANAYLSPPSGESYRKNELIFVTCKQGYEVVGGSSFHCGVDTVLPSCQSKFFKTPLRSGRVTHLKGIFLKTYVFLLLTYLVYQNLICGTLICLLLIWQLGLKLKCIC